MNDQRSVRVAVCGGLLAVASALTGCISSAASSDAGVGGQGPDGGGIGGAPGTADVELLTPLVAAFCGAARACCGKGGFPPDRDRKSTRLNSSHPQLSRMPSSA